MDLSSNLFKTFIWDGLFKMEAINLILIAFKLSPQGFLGGIIAKLVTVAFEKAYPVFKKVVNVGSIKVSNEIHQKSYEIAQIKLRVIALKSGQDSQEFKEQREVEREKFYRAIKFNDGILR